VSIHSFNKATFSTFSGEETEKNCPFILFNKATRELNKTTGKQTNTKSKQRRAEKEKILSTKSQKCQNGISKVYLN